MTLILTPANRAERLFAYLIDALVLFIPASIITQLLSSTNGAGEIVVNRASILIVFVCTCAYYVFFTAGRWQATPGKRLLGMYVCKQDGRALTQSEALERFLAFIMPSLPLYTSFLSETAGPMLAIWLHLFWFVPIFTTQGRTGMHDVICATQVVAGRT